MCVCVCVCVCVLKQYFNYKTINKTRLKTHK